MSEPKRISELTELTLGTSYSTLPSGIFVPIVKSENGSQVSRKIDLNTLLTLVYQASQNYTDEQIQSASLNPGQSTDPGQGGASSAEIEELTSRINTLSNLVSANQSNIAFLQNPANYPIHEITLIDANDQNNKVTYKLPCGPGAGKVTLKVPTTQMPNILYTVTLGWDSSPLSLVDKTVSAYVQVIVDGTGHEGGTIGTIAVKADCYYVAEVDTAEQVTSFNTIVLKSTEKTEVPTSRLPTLTGTLSGTLPVVPSYYRVVTQLIIDNVNVGVISYAMSSGRNEPASYTKFES